MAINTDGPKKQGRFLKKNSKLLDFVQMVDFSFEEICSQPLVGFDNSSSTIIHSKFHDPKKLATVVKPHATLDNDIFDPNQQALGIIFPADFTQDWHNERLQGKRRALGFDEEDEIDFAAVARNRGAAVTATAAPAAPSKSPDPIPAVPVELAPTPAAGNVLAAQPSDISSVGAPETDGKVVALKEADLASAISKEFATTHVDAKNVKANNSAQDALANENNLSFTPLPTTSGSDPIAAEDLAIESWKMKQAAAKQNEEMLNSLRGQKNAAQVFSKVGDLLNEFGNLKGLVLENVQKNFFEVSQAIAESLLGKEFSINPQAYATMIQRVIKDTTSPNEFKVRMHPETWQKVHELSVPDLDNHLVKDPTIPVGEFRVESALTVVDVSAKKLVTQLLESADINLFTDKKTG